MVTIFSGRDSIFSCSFLPLEPPPLITRVIPRIPIIRKAISCTGILFAFMFVRFSYLLGPRSEYCRKISLTYIFLYFLYIIGRRMQYTIEFELWFLSRSGWENNIALYYQGKATRSQIMYSSDISQTVLLPQSMKSICPPHEIKSCN